jgi:hypothetical protein
MFVKFLVTVLLIAVVWFGFRFVQRSAESRRVRRDAPPAPPGVQDLAQCRVCGSWVTPKHCGRRDCPY